MVPWHVTITANIPYPWSRSFTINCTGAGTAAARAIKMYRKAIKQEKGRAKKINDFDVAIRRGKIVGGKDIDDPVLPGMEEYILPKGDIEDSVHKLRNIDE